MNDIKIIPHPQFTKESPWYLCLERGSATSDLWWFIAVIVALGIIWYATGGPNHPEAWRGPFIEPPAPLGTGEIYGAGDYTSSPRAGYSNIYDSNDPNIPPPTSRSPWYGQVAINRGSASYEIQPNQEYITLEANYNNQGPVTVTGWFLTNAKNQLDVVTIPRAVHLFIGDSANLVTVPITLSPGGRVVLTTGQVPTSDSYKINANFLINQCTGYLESSPYYQFSPSLNYSCPNPEKDPGVRNLNKECYDFVSHLAYCHTPKVEYDVEKGDLIDGSSLESSCRAFLKEHFNYNACVKWHEQDPDFYGNEWRVFLGRSWELWAENRETITLYDQSGKIVDQESY